MQHPGRTGMLLRPGQVEPAGQGGRVTAVSLGLVRACDLLCWGFWSWVLICLGPRLLRKLPPDWHVDDRWMLIGCAAFIASGAFVFAHVLGQCLPQTNRWIRLLGVSLPWIGLAGVVIGGVV